MPADIVHLKPTRPCPICGKPSAQAHHPFCSARCQDVDLNRWLSGSYHVPTEEGPDEPAPTSDQDD
jgi:uncharacterized protein